MPATPSPEGLPPPDAEGCLVQSYPSSQKGGTLIAEDVHDLETHKQRLADTDGYRPARCGRCQHDVLHVHEYRQRLLLCHCGDPATMVVIHRCAHRDCGATWRILPAFIARRLRRTWATVESETISEVPSPSRPKVPGRTVRRWMSRLATAARHVVQVLAAAGDQALWQLALAVGMNATRRRLVVMGPAAAAGRLSPMAALVHRLCAGVRLM